MRAMLALAAEKQLSLYYVEISIAYFNNHLEEYVYMNLFDRICNEDIFNTRFTDVSYIPISTNTRQFEARTNTYNNI